MRQVFYAAIVFATFACSSGTKAPATVEQRARAEFDGAYPAEASPTGVVRAFDIVAAPTKLPLADESALEVWAYNGQVPGPVLRVRLGETLRVRFHNELPQETTIHWHGVRVPNAMDGVPHLTQKPVQPGETFIYEFTPKDAGTFWFHPHVRASEQVERGLYGVLVVEDVRPLPYSRELTWVLDDWLLKDGAIYPAFNTRHDLAMDGRWGNKITVNGRTDTIEKVQPGERLRIRMLNTANGRVFAPDFGELDAKIIAVDGMYLREPIPARDFELAPGNRIDVDVTFAKSSSEPLVVMDRFSTRRSIALARFEVDGVLVDTPRFDSPARAVVPRWLDAREVAPAHTFRLDARSGGPLGIEWTIDGVAFMNHEHPMPPATTLERDRFARLRFTNVSPRIHPIHLHGMFFRLLARNGIATDEPFFRDTVLIQPREEIDIGLVPTDVGVWMMHCHILEHAEAGMMTTIAVAGSAVRSNERTTP